VFWVEKLIYWDFKGIFIGVFRLEYIEKYFYFFAEKPITWTSDQPASGWSGWNLKIQKMHHLFFFFLYKKVNIRKKSGLTRGHDLLPNKLGTLARRSPHAWPVLLFSFFFIGIFI
jgi:hypothetical protein